MYQEPEEDALSVADSVSSDTEIGETMVRPLIYVLLTNQLFMSFYADFLSFYDVTFSCLILVNF